MITVLLTDKVSDRAPISAADLPSMCGNDNHLLLAAIDVCQARACEAVRLWQRHAPNSQAFAEKESGQQGWRAHLSPETVHLIHVLEECHSVAFELETEAA